MTGTGSSTTGLPAIRIQCADCGRQLRAHMGELTRCACGRDHWPGGPRRQPDAGTMRALAAAERAVFFRMAEEHGLSAEEAREIAAEARARSGGCASPEGSERQQPGSERIAYHLDCVCGIHIEMPLERRPTADFRCPSCGVTYRPEQLFEVIRSSPEHELRLMLLKQALSIPRRRPEPARKTSAPLARISRRRLVVAPVGGDETAWALSFIVGVLVPIAAAVVLWQLGGGV